LRSDLNWADLVN